MFDPNTLNGHQLEDWLSPLWYIQPMENEEKANLNEILFGYYYIGSKMVFTKQDSVPEPLQFWARSGSKLCWWVQGSGFYYCA